MNLNRCKCRCFGAPLVSSDAQVAHLGKFHIPQRLLPEDPRWEGKKMEPNSRGGEGDVAFPEVVVNHFRCQRDIAFIAKGGMGSVLKKSRIYPGNRSCPGVWDMDAVKE